MFEFVAKGLRTAILTVCVLGASAAIAQPAPANLDAVSSAASRYSVLSDALWTMGSDAVPERLETAQAAFAANPTSAEANLRLGLAMRLEHPEAAALGLDPGRAEALDSRGLVKLRLGDLSGAIADYDEALKTEPPVTTALYGRGLAKRRSGDAAGGDVDLAKARELEPGIDQSFARFGVTP